MAVAVAVAVAVLCCAVLWLCCDVLWLSVLWLCCAVLWLCAVLYCGCDTVCCVTVLCAVWLCHALQRERVFYLVMPPTIKYRIKRKAAEVSATPPTLQAPALDPGPTVQKERTISNSYDLHAIAANPCSAPTRPQNPVWASRIA